MNFTVEETNLMCIYNTGSRADLLSELAEMQTHLQSDETELKEIASSVIAKLQAMSHTDFIAASDEPWLILSRRKPTCFHKTTDSFHFRLTHDISVSI